MSESEAITLQKWKAATFPKFSQRKHSRGANRTEVYYMYVWKCCNETQ
jgi:hypothetical protein